MQSLVRFDVTAVMASPSLTCSTVATKVRGVAAWAEMRRNTKKLTAMAKAVWQTNTEGPHKLGIALASCSG